MSKIYEIKIKDIKGQETSLENFKDKALLIVNVASKCGFTPQYAGLNELYKKHKEKGLVVLGFPCNQFGGQEPGSEKEIQDFCDLTFKVEFPMFAKVDVNGDQEHPLFHLLKEEAPGILGTKAVKWNFTKFLVNKKGEVVKRFAPNDKPEEIEDDISKIL